MTRWKPLPDGVAPPVRDLVGRLRELKDQVGISTTALARRTAYRRSAWTRCLDGRAVPPPPAVRTLGELAGLTGAALAVLLASRDWAEQAEPALATATAEPPVAWWRHWWSWVAAAVGTASVALAVVGLTGPPTTPGAQAPPAPGRTSVAPAGYSCAYTDKDGRWYAGHSTTSTGLVMVTSYGQDVIEVQCLLKRQGMDPGQVDGLFGEHTERAVKQLQSAAGVRADGKVGPQTWALLRR